MFAAFHLKHVLLSTTGRSQKKRWFRREVEALFVFALQHSASGGIGVHIYHNLIRPCRHCVLLPYTFFCLLPNIDVD